MVVDCGTKVQNLITVLRYCEWKGRPVPCAAIFTKFPTDLGMCCSFNIRAAEDIFQDGAYAKVK